MSGRNDYPDDVPLDSISFGGSPPSPAIRKLLKLYGFKLESDGIHWSRLSGKRPASEMDLITEAMEDEYFASRDEIPD